MIQRTSEVGKGVGKGIIKKRDKIVSLNSIVILAIYELDYTFETNNNSVTTPIERQYIFMIWNNHIGN